MIHPGLILHKFIYTAAPKDVNGNSSKPGNVFMYISNCIAKFEYVQFLDISGIKVTFGMF